MPRPALRIGLLVLFLTAIVAQASAQCPESTVSCRAERNPSDVVIEETQTSNAPAARVECDLSWAYYDLVAGTVGAKADVLIPIWRQRSRAVATDNFELHGLPAVAVTIRMTLTLHAGYDPRQTSILSIANLTAAGQTVTAQSTGYLIAPFIEINAVMVEGQPMAVTYEAFAEGSGNEPFVTLEASIQFIGVPPAAWITSCNGFGAPPVPTRTTTWGAVKALYR